MIRGSLRTRAGAALAQVSSWAIVGAAVLAAVALVVDATLVVKAGAPLRTALGAALVAASLGALVALALAPGVALLAAAARAIAVLDARAHLLWPAPIVVAAGAATWWLTDPLTRRAAPIYVGLSIVVALVVGLTAWLARATPSGLARAVAALIAVAAVAGDVWIQPTHYPELHAVAHLVMASALLSVATPLRRRLDHWRPGRLAAIAVAVALLAVTITCGVDRAAPGWRSFSTQRALHATRLSRVLRALVDLDRDGYSAIAWGADCDDLDPGRNPGVRDEPGGGDANCNGVDPPLVPVAADVGMAAAVGTAHAPAGTIDLVLLVIADAMRADVVTPELTPRLWGLGERGLVLERVYAGGSRTNVSVPLMLRSVDEAPLVTTRLASSGIATSIVRGTDVIGDLGCEVKRSAPDATRLTDAAIARIREVGDAPHFAFVHYNDTHKPYPSRSPVPAPPVRTDLPAAYRAQVAYVDREIGRLIDALVDAGRLDHALVIVTADHGEGFGEHGVRSHGSSGFDAVIRVPGVVLAPGLAPSRDDRRLLSHRGLPATILGAFGLAEEAAAAEKFGRSWMRLRDAPLDAPLHEFVVVRSARFSSGRLTNSPLAALVGGRYKLVASFEDRAFELYDMLADPDEHTNLAPRHPGTVRSLWRRLALYCDLDYYP